MIEQAFILLFVYAFGLASGRAIRDYQIARQTVTAMTALYNSEWWASHPSSQSELHRVQDVTGEMPPLVLSQTTYCRLLHHSVKAR